VILLQTIIEVLIGSVPHARTKLCPDCPRIGIVAVCRDSIRDHSGDRLCRSKEARGRGEVAVLAEHDVDQGAISIDRAVEVLPLAVHTNVRLVDIPTTTDFAPSASPEILRQCGRELGLPIADRLIAEYDAADQEHLDEIPQTELVAQPPKHHERDHVARVLRPVQ